jgi:hypothetical protein
MDNFIKRAMLTRVTPPLLGEVEWDATCVNDSINRALVSSQRVGRKQIANEGVEHLRDARDMA